MFINFMKKAELFEVVDSQKKIIKCKACAQECVISPGKLGLCGVRKNQEGILYSLTYEKLIAQHIDPIEKKPLFDFMPSETKVYSIGTVGCNFSCDWCQNFDISQIKREYEILGKDVSPEEVVKSALKNNCECIAYTYNEPAINIEFVRDTARLAKEKGLKNILVTNGYFTKESFEYLNKENLIDAMNIDLKAFKDETYRKYCNAVHGLQPVLDTIKRAYEAGIHLEITTLVIPDLNDSSREVEKIAEFIFSLDSGGGGIPWHLSRFFPMFKFADWGGGSTDIKTMERAKEIGGKVGLKKIYLGNV